MCPICLSVMFEIYELNNCGHLFCEDCIKRLEECSLCKNNQIQYYKSKYLKRKLYEQNVKCYSPDCDKIFALSEADQHFNSCHQMCNKINSEYGINTIINNKDQNVVITDNDHNIENIVTTDNDHDIIENVVISEDHITDIDSDSDIDSIKNTKIVIAVIVLAIFIYIIYKYIWLKIV